MKLLEIIKQLIESRAAEEANKLGLTHIGYGYWADANGNTVARTLSGELVRLDTNKLAPPKDDRKIVEPKLDRAGYLLSQYIEGIMIHQPLEDALAANDELAQELEAAFAPIREKIRNNYGNTITLYRAQRPLKGDEPSRGVLSWTSSKNVANSFGGGAMDVYSLRSPNADYDGGYDDVADALGRSSAAFLDKQEMEMAFQSLKTQFPDLEMEVHPGRPQDHPVIEREIPVDDLVWFSDRYDQKEFIVRNRGVSKISHNDNG